MATFYRTMSQAEYQDYKLTGLFRTADNTLEAKQFFKTQFAVREFVSSARLRHYHPPYKHLIKVKVADEKFSKIKIDHLNLDGFEAISVPEEQMDAFNNCINFVNEELL